MKPITFVKTMVNRKGRLREYSFDTLRWLKMGQRNGRTLEFMIAAHEGFIMQIRADRAEWRKARRKARRK